MIRIGVLLRSRWCVILGSILPPAKHGDPVYREPPQYTAGRAVKVPAGLPRWGLPEHGLDMNYRPNAG